MIDECTPALRTLRTQLALFTLNRGAFDSSTFSDTDLTALVSYTLTLSPRRDDLVLISDSPDNIAGRLQATPLGLRFVGSAVTREGNRVYRFAHAPTGTFITSTSHTGTLARVSVSADGPRNSRWKRPDMPLRPHELEATEFVDALDDDVRRLLAAVFVRLGASDQRTWAVGQFFEDPLGREPAEWWSTPLSARRTRRVLTGSGARWELRWSGAPFPSDVVRAALTDPRCGLNGATVIREDRGFEYELSFGRARLLVRPV